MRAGLPIVFWTYAVVHFCFAKNIAAMSDDPMTSPYYKRFGDSFDGCKIPFGAQVWYKPSERMAKRLPKYAGTAIPSIFLAYEQKAGCRWNGRYILAPKVTLESWKEGKRVEHDVVKEVHWNPRSTELIFPCRETLDRRERLNCQDIVDDDIIGDPQLREDQPKEQRAKGAVEQAQLESQVTDPTSSVQGRGPPSPLIPTDESPRSPKE